jgi:hypothetical protein
MAYHFMRSFAKDNDLTIIEACLLPNKHWLNKMETVVSYLFKLLTWFNGPPHLTAALDHHKIRNKSVFV